MFTTNTKITFAVIFVYRRSFFSCVSHFAHKWSLSCTPIWFCNAGPLFKGDNVHKDGDSPLLCGQSELKSVKGNVINRITLIAYSLYTSCVNGTFVSSYL